MIKFIPSDELRAIGQKYGFPCLVLVSWDGERTNVASWGLNPNDKEAAAHYASAVLASCVASDAALRDAEVHEDFRTTPQHELKAEVDRLKAENEKLREDVRALREIL